MNVMRSRNDAMTAFLTEAAWGEAEQRPLAGDA
jgi:hypothetical protein